MFIKAKSWVCFKTEMFVTCVLTKKEFTCMGILPVPLQHLGQRYVIIKHRSEELFSCYADTLLYGFEMFVTEMFVTMKCKCTPMPCGVWSVHHDTLFRRWHLGARIMFVMQAKPWKRSFRSDAVILNSSKFTVAYTLFMQSLHHS